MLRTVVILAGHGRGMTAFKAKPFTVTGTTRVHFLWKFGCTFNDPVSRLPTVLDDAISNEVKTQSSKNSTRYEAVHGPGSSVKEHMLLETQLDEREGFWDPMVVAKTIQKKTLGSLSDVMIDKINNIECELIKVIPSDFSPGKVQQFIMLSLKPTGSHTRALSLSEIVDYASQKPWAQTDIYWWACRSPASDFGDYGGFMYAAKWKFYGNTYAPGDDPN